MDIPHVVRSHASSVGDIHFLRVLTTNESYMRHWWWVIHEALMSHTWGIDELYLRHCWLIHEALKSHTWGICESYMRHYKSWLQLKGGASPKMDDHMAISSFTWGHLVRAAMLAATSRTLEMVLPKHMTAHMAPKHHLYNKQRYRTKSFSCLASILL